MFLKSKFLIFIPSLVFGSIIAISSSSWLFAWAGLEINLMSMAPILISNVSYCSIEASIKYFLTQAMASSLIIFFSAMSLNFHNFNLLMGTELIFSSALMLKAGVAPLHFWFPQVMSYSEWPQCLILLTCQKMAPLFLISFLNNSLNMIFILSSALIGMLGALNQVKLKEIMAYSSISHSAWMIYTMTYNELIWWIYFLVYSLLNFSTLLMPLLFKFNSINGISLVPAPISVKLVMLLNFFSLAGVPPFLGFFAKLAAVNTLVFNHANLMTLSVLIMSSFISFYFYSRILYSSLLVNSASNFFYLSYNMQILDLTMIWSSNISILGNLLPPLLFIFN